MNVNQYISAKGELCNSVLINIAEILTLRLPEGVERILAAKWVKKFIACKPEDYTHYLSLFVSSLTKLMLVPPFEVRPVDQSGVWQEFEFDYTDADIQQAIKNRKYKDAIAPPYRVEISSDMQEYVAFQEIPLFGAHFFYAFSPTEKIHQWQNFNRLNIPNRIAKALQLEQEAESPIKGRATKARKAIQQAKTQQDVRSKPLTSAPQVDWEGPLTEGGEAEPEAVVEASNTNVPNVPAHLQRLFNKTSSQTSEAAKARLANETPAERLLRAKQYGRTKPLVASAAAKQTAPVQTPAQQAANKKIAGPVIPKFVPNPIYDEAFKAEEAAGSTFTRKQFEQVHIAREINKLNPLVILQPLPQTTDASQSTGAIPKVKPVVEPPTKEEKKERLKREVLIAREIHERKKREFQQTLDGIKDQAFATTEKFTNEVNRARREGTANSREVDEIHDQEIQLGEGILRSFDRPTPVVDQDLQRDLQNLTLQQLAPAKERPVRAVQATLDRMAQLKEMQTASLATSLIELTEAVCGAALAHMDGVASNQPETQNEAVLDEKLMNSDKVLLNKSVEIAERVNAAVETNAADTAEVLKTSLKELKGSIENHVSSVETAIREDANPPQGTVAAAAGEAEDLEGISDRAEETFKRFDTFQNVYRAGIIDLEAEDLELPGGFLDEAAHQSGQSTSIWQASRHQAQSRRDERQANEEENLFDESMDDDDVLL